MRRLQSISAHLRIGLSQPTVALTRRLLTTAATSSQQRLKSTHSKKMSSAESKKTVVEVKLTVDVACPWCFIGERRLYKALDSLDAKSYDVKVSIHPFLLAPDAPTPGGDRKELVKAKYGISEEKYQANFAGMKQKGLEQAGITFTPTGPSGNTINALRLITWAQTKYGADAGRKVLDAIQSAVFEKSQDASLTPTLVAAAKTAGVSDEKTVTDFLASTEGVEATKTASNEAKTAGVKTVPNIYINGKFAEDGSQHDFNAFFKQLGLIKA